MAVLALLLHVKALWTGLRDEGDVAAELIEERDAYTYGRSNDAHDVYRRQTAGFRGWQLQKQGGGLSAHPGDNPAIRFLTGLTWAGVAAVASVAYLVWYGFPGFGPGIRYREPVQVAEIIPVKVSAKAVTPAAAQPVQPAPPPAEHVVVAAPPPAPMPNVQRPTGVSNSIEAAGSISGPNEAIAQRGHDGSFAFDAVVNGNHVRMLFDTGATVVGLRAEDAERLGIPVNNLSYSAKIKTANGTAEVAPVTIDTMIIGNITLRKVSGFVAKEGALPQNLLGQTFLTRLAGFNVQNNLLILHGR